MTPPPAAVGMPADEIDTPALILDLDAFERNMALMQTLMAQAAGGRPVRLRPHAKCHKSVAIAHRLAGYGAVGQCVQKVGEAEILVQGGVPDVLVSNQVVAPSKLARLAALARSARVGVCVDGRQNVEDIAAACTTAGTRLDVYIEVDVGQGRCGVTPGQPIVDLAKAIVGHASLNFMGLQAYHGKAQHLRGWAERKAAIDAAAALVGSTRDALEAAGIPCARITGAGTGSFEFEIASGVWDEIQCGSFIFMDADYARNHGQDGKEGGQFEQSLFVLAGVMSRPGDDRAILDAGHKAVAIDSGLPLLFGMPDYPYVGAADEHGRVNLPAGSNRLAVGDKVRLVPGHCDPTVNLHDWYVGVRGGTVECVWPVSARGAMR
jgi:3-hydroxy-D-aspartate aldolase